eukprot:1143367-Pelagomonas_calceolata.AAC.3
MLMLIATTRPRCCVPCKQTPSRLLSEDQFRELYCFSVATVSRGAPGLHARNSPLCIQSMRQMHGSFISIGLLACEGAPMSRMLC